MKVKRMFAFRVIALLMLTALVMMPMVPASANPDPWWWIPGTWRFHCVEGSERIISICTWPTDASVMNRTVPFACEQYYDVVYSSPDVNGEVNVTVPRDSWHQDPFFLKTLGPFYVWMQLYAVGDGNGTLATGNTLDVSPVSIVVTGNGTGGFDSTIVIGDGVPDGAGSEIFSMPLNNSVWMGKSATDPTEVLFLFNMSFPMISTTGFIEITIDDSAGPYPQGPPQSLSMNGYYENATGVPFDSEKKTFLGTTLVGAGAGLDIYADLPGIGPAYTDYIFVDYEVFSVPPVGGAWIPVDKLALLAPYIALASAIILAAVATAIFKYRKKQ